MRNCTVFVHRYSGNLAIQTIGFNQFNFALQIDLKRNGAGDFLPIFFVIFKVQSTNLNVIYFFVTLTFFLLFLTYVEHIFMFLEFSLVRKLLFFMFLCFMFYYAKLELLIRIFRTIFCSPGQQFFANSNFYILAIIPIFH